MKYEDLELVQSLINEYKALSKLTNTDKKITVKISECDPCEPNTGITIAAHHLKPTLKEISEGVKEALIKLGVDMPEYIVPPCKVEWE